MSAFDAQLNIQFIVDFKIIYLTRSRMLTISPEIQSSDTLVLRKKRKYFQ